MKHIIFNLDGQKISSYEGPKDETSTNRSYLLCPPHAIHVELPEGVDEDCISLQLVPEVTEQESHPEMWTNGESIVYNVNDIPVLLDKNNEPYLDPSFQYVAAKPAKEAHYVIIENARLVLAKRKKIAEEKLNEIRVIRDSLLEKADILIFKLEDDNLDSSKARQYRKELRNCTDILKDSEGKAKIECADMVVSEFNFPTLEG